MKVYLFIFSALLIFSGCKKELVGPEYDIPGRRGIQFFGEIIQNAYCTEGNIFAATSSEIWFSNSRGLYKFDGSRYQHFSDLAYMKMGGSGANDIWGFRSWPEMQIYHYDGRAWTQFENPILPDTLSHIEITSVSGVDKYNVYASGTLHSGNTSASVLLYWNGTSWKYAHSNPGYIYYDLIPEAGNIKKLYIRALNYYTGEYVVLKFESGKLETIYSSNEYFSTVRINGELLIFKNNTISRLNGMIYKTFYSSNQFYQIKAVSANDIFLIGSTNNNPSLFHYNGNDIAELMQVKYSTILSADKQTVITIVLQNSSIEIFTGIRK